MSKLILKENPTLADFQKYIKQMRKIRGFEKESPVEECLLLGEEVGELFKAVRKHATDISFDNKNSKVTKIAHELSDVFSMLLCVTSNLGVDLEKAFREKEKINKQRKWN